MSQDKWSSQFIQKKFKNKHKNVIYQHSRKVRKQNYRRRQRQHYDLLCKNYISPPYAETLYQHYRTHHKAYNVKSKHETLHPNSPQLKPNLGPFCSFEVTLQYYNGRNWCDYIATSPNTSTKKKRSRNSKQFGYSKHLQTEHISVHPKCHYWCQLGGRSPDIDIWVIHEKYLDTTDNIDSINSKYLCQQTHSIHKYYIKKCGNLLYIMRCFHTIYGWVRRERLTKIIPMNIDSKWIVSFTGTSWTPKFQSEIDIHKARIDIDKYVILKYNQDLINLIPSQILNNSKIKHATLDIAQQKKILRTFNFEMIVQFVLGYGIENSEQKQYCLNAFGVMKCCNSEIFNDVCLPEGVIYNVESPNELVLFCQQMIEKYYNINEKQNNLELVWKLYVLTQYEKFNIVDIMMQYFDYLDIIKSVMVPLIGYQYFHCVAIEGKLNCDTHTYNKCQKMAITSRTDAISFCRGCKYINQSLGITVYIPSGTRF